MERLTKPHYSKAGSEKIFTQLRRDVNKLANEAVTNYRPAIVFKAILFPLLYILVYSSALHWGSYKPILFGCYFLLGLLLVIIFLNIIHDAVHESVFKT